MKDGLWEIQRQKLAVTFISLIRLTYKGLWKHLKETGIVMAESSNGKIGAVYHEGQVAQTSCILSVGTAPLPPGLENSGAWAVCS